MSRTGPDMIMSKSNVSDKPLGDSDNNKFHDHKKKAFVKKNSIMEHLEALPLPSSKEELKC